MDVRIETLEAKGKKVVRISGQHNRTPALPQDALTTAQYDRITNGKTRDDTVFGVYVDASEKASADTGEIHLCWGEHVCVTNMKVVIEQAILQGSRELLQRVATVYVDGQEFRVLAPPAATGDALGWVEHFHVRTLDPDGSEIAVGRQPKADVIERCSRNWNETEAELLA